MMGQRSSAARIPLVALALVSVLWGAGTGVPAQSATTEAATTEADLVSARVGALLQIVTEVDAEAAIAALEAAEADTGLSLSAREQILHDFALQLREEAESVPGRRALEWLTGYRSQVMVQHEERGPATITKWRVAGVARGTLALWDRAATAGQVQRRMAVGTMDLAGEVAEAEAAQDMAALTKAFRTAPPEQLSGQRDRLLAMLKRDGAVAPAAAEAALRLRDPELASAVLASGDRQTAARLIAALGDALPAGQAFAVLREASRDDALGSAAIVAIGEAAGELPAAQDFLLEILSDPERGGSAAAALAAVEGDEMVSVVAAGLEASDDAAFQSKGVLMLVLNGSPLARESLRDFLRRPGVSEELRREASAWLQEGTE